MKNKTLDFLISLIFGFSLVMVLMPLTSTSTNDYSTVFYYSLIPLLLSLGVALWEGLMEHLNKKSFIAIGLVIAFILYRLFIVKDEMFLTLSIINLICSISLITFYSIKRIDNAKKEK
ncbi:MAG: hypothetical protein ACK5MH_07695 [Bacteroidales bacterium]